VQIMKQRLIFCFLILLSKGLFAQLDSVNQKSWIRNKTAFGRSQHILYFGNNKVYKTNTLFNKAYYASFAPVQIKGFKPFLSLNYEYFITQAICYTCVNADNIFSSKKQLHFINLASLGLGFSQEIKFKNKKGKEFELIFGASIERYLFKRAFIFNQNELLKKATPFVSADSFFNQYFFKDLYGFRVYNSINYKVFIQLSGIMLRNERLRYEPSRYTFHNFMLGFNVFLK
jgi:hypothetical protein